MKNLVKVLKSLEGPTLVLAHHNADADSICAALVLRNILVFMGKEDVKIGVPDTISSVAQKVIGDDRNRIEVYQTKDFTNTVIVDAASIEQIQPLKLESKYSVMIDHHSEGSLKESVDYAFIDSKYKATCSIIFDLAKETEYNIDVHDAKLLMAGMIADTAHMKLADKRIFLQLAELTDRISLQDVLPSLTQEADYSERVAILKALSRTSLHRCGDYIIAVSHISSHEAPAARALAMYADVGVVIAKREKEIRISARAKKSLSGKIHLANDIMSKISETIGGSGGGHDLAASANGSNPDKAKEAEKRILELISNKLGDISTL